VRVDETNQVLNPMLVVIKKEAIFKLSGSNELIFEGNK